MKAPLTRLTKAEIIWLGNHRCTHRHTYLDHYNCYLTEVPGSNERIGFFDIETTGGFNADWGSMLSWCIKEGGQDKVYHDLLTKSDIASQPHGEEDRRIVTSCVKTLQEFDKVVTYYGKRFDMPYLRTRAMIMGIQFPEYGTTKHIDVYDIVKRKFKLSSNRMQNACEYIVGESDKTRLDHGIWKAAGRGDAEALKYILEHNIADVWDTEKLYNKVIKFVRKQDTSI